MEQPPNIIKHKKTEILNLFIDKRSFKFLSKIQKNLLLERLNN
jgi:hypothetical protein